MKIGILTIDSRNYGNRLQNYALQLALEKMGYDVYSISRRKPESSAILRLYRTMTDSLKIVMGTKSGKYVSFNRRYIRRSKSWASANEYCADLAGKFDYFVVGSDQVWNPYYMDMPHEPVGKCDLLSFAKSEQKISYAASFGVSSIPEEKKQFFSNALNDFHRISVREKKGAEIVSGLTDKKCSVVLDPVLLLNRDEWKKIEKETNTGKPYVLLYFIDEKERCDQLRKENSGLNFIDVLEIQKNGKPKAYGPREFLYLIDNAQEVWTNSFHATAFSLLFHVPVKTYSRKGLDMSSRITTLAELSGIETKDRPNQSSQALVIQDFSVFDRNLMSARKESLDFLRESLE